VLDVDERGDIRSFVQRNGLMFKQGRGFYEFTKPEKVSDKKEVVLVDKVCVCVCVRACLRVCVAGTSTIKSWKFITLPQGSKVMHIWKLQGRSSLVPTQKSRRKTPGYEAGDATDVQHCS